MDMQSNLGKEYAAVLSHDSVSQIIIWCNTAYEGLRDSARHHPISSREYRALMDDADTFRQTSSYLAKLV